VAGLALMVSQMQKETMIRESHQADVEGEELKIQSIELVNSRNEWNVTLANETNSRGNWSSLKFGLLNLNTKDSQVTGIGVRPGSSGIMRYAWNYTSGNEIYNLSHRLTIPATKSEVVELNLVANFSSVVPPDPLYIHTDDPVTIRVITSLQKVFETTFRPPIAAMRTKIESEDLFTGAQRSILILDGSDSTDDGTVMKWNWTVLDGSNTLPEPGTWDDVVNIDASYYEGKIVRVEPSSSGPFQIGLTVTDDTGMTGTSRMVTIPRSGDFSPAVAMVVNRTMFPDIKVSVFDIGGHPVSGSVVNFLRMNDPFGNLTLSNWSAATDSHGTVLTTWLDGMGTIRVISGKLSPVDLPV